MEKLKIAVCGACLLVVAILGYCYVSKKQNEKYEHIINSAISNIVDTVIEKYPDVVTVYTIGDVSKELCGGPHVKNTSELGHFKIKKEEASSAGVRRIKAILE